MAVWVVRVWCLGFRVCGLSFDIVFEFPQSSSGGTYSQRVCGRSTAQVLLKVIILGDSGCAGFSLGPGESKVA